VEILDELTLSATEQVDQHRQQLLIAAQAAEPFLQRSTTGDDGLLGELLYLVDSPWRPLRKPAAKPFDLRRIVKSAFELRPLGENSIDDFVSQSPLLLLLQVVQLGLEDSSQLSYPCA